ncbi:MAG: hypothetical protein DRO11_03695 [Methanobacteriota archaeon]|nr:MAG: hypothetical protein DRO11_03695 [Euryarchaeota archaeon]
MSLLGFGLGFGARDEGMEAAMDNSIDSLDKMNDLLETQDEIAKNSKIGVLMSGLANLSISGLGDQLKDLTGEGANLTNSMEAFGVASNKTMRPILAQMGKVGSEASKLVSEFSGMSRALNIDVDTIARGYQVYDGLSDKTRAAFSGMNLSFKDLLKLEASGIAPLQTMANIVGGFSKGWEGTGEQAKELVDQALRMGQAAKLAKPIDMVDASLKSLGETFASAPDKYAPGADAIAGMVKSSVKAAGLLRKFDVSSEDATAQALAFQKQMATSLVSIQKHDIGAGEFDELATTLSKIGGSDWGVDMIKLGTTDPAQFVEKFNKALNDTKKDGGDLTFFDKAKKSFEGMGADLTFLLYGGKEAAQSFADMDKSVSNMQGKGAGIKDLADSYRTGYTAQDRATMQQEGFETALRKIAGVDMNEFLKNKQKGFSNIRESLEKYANDDSWGTVTKRMIALKEYGVVGLFMPLADKTGEAADEMTHFQSVMMNFGPDMLQGAQEVAPIVTAIGTTFLLLKPIILGIGRAFWWLIGKVLWPVAKFLFTKIVFPIVTGIAAFLGAPVALVAALVVAIGLAFTYIYYNTDQFLGYWSDVGSKIGTWFSEVWTEIKLFAESIGTVLMRWAVGIGDWFSSIWDTISISIGEAFQSIADWWNLYLQEPIEKGLVWLEKVFEPITNAINEHIIDPILELKDALVDVGGEMITSLMEGMTDKWKALKKWFGEVVGDLKKMFDFLPDIFGGAEEPEIIEEKANASVDNYLSMVAGAKQDYFKAEAKRQIEADGLSTPGFFDSFFGGGDEKKEVEIEPVKKSVKLTPAQAKKAKRASARRAKRNKQRLKRGDIRSLIREVRTQGDQTRTILSVIADNTSSKLIGKPGVVPVTTGN